MTEEQKASIEHNKRHGLLCACNQQMIPYYDKEGKEHGTRVVKGIEHGYDDCHPVEES